MASNKLQRTNEDIHRVLASLLRNIKDPRIANSMISVTSVDTTSDLRYARVYLSAFGAQSEKELQKGLKSASGYLRRELGHALSLRYTPELIFELDKSIEHGAHISKILSGLTISAEDKTEEDED